MAILTLIKLTEDHGVCDICATEKAVCLFYSYKLSDDGHSVKVSTKSCLNDTKVARLLLRKKIKAKDENKTSSR